MADERVMELEGFDELIQWVDETHKMGSDLWFAVHDAMSQCVQVVESKAKEKAPVAFGQLRAGISSEVMVTDDAIEGVVSTSLGKATGGKLVGYAPAVEYGSKPHWAPLEPLVEWVRVKRISGVYSLKTGNRLGKKADKINEDISAAMGIQRRIAVSGTKAQPFFNPALDESREAIQDLWRKALDSLAKSFSNGGKSGR